jgi:hypothetical protein
MIIGPKFGGAQVDDRDFAKRSNDRKSEQDVKRSMPSRFLANSSHVKLSIPNKGMC